ncbi:AraC family transcriptional regulator [Herbivorax sp. ANBcel31]|uniref:AraC family transcriptional regulator n=1 Tax=Herbivorax sp. ANBcel31 TaxID=3069754 RepID=UPI0027B1CC56|nr:AraC family transcriptional regulator [Herbivorax sp. ANBcel31]MDQ2087717.1 AraC family transcriptional regulator [Herbivorax sp. ANBcel31]
MSNNHLDNLVPSIEYFVNRKLTPSWKVEKSLIDFNDLTFVYSGKATYIVNDVEYTLKHGDFIYVPEGSVREAYTYENEPVQCYSINFNWLFPDNVDFPLQTKFNTGTFNDLMHLYKELENVWLEKKFGYVIKSRAIFMLILHKILEIKYYKKSQIVVDQRIQQIKNYILSNYNQNISIKTLSEMVNLNPVYLGALFKKYNNCSLKEYLNMIRINTSENLLCTGGYSVSEAAHLCGFNDIFYFSKQFKKQRGYPPSFVLKKQ